MRIVAELPHEVMKITVFSWNEKYLLKYELGSYEQTYKVGVMDVGGLDEVKRMANDDFNSLVFQRFLAMRTDFTENWKQLQNTPS